MATNTTQYNFQKPEVGGDSDNWGDMLNGNWDTTDSLLRGATALTRIGIGTTNSTLPLICNAATTSDIAASFSGLVGIGTTSPDTRLHVDGGDVKISSDADASNGDGKPTIFFSESGADEVYAQISYHGDDVTGTNNFIGIGCIGAVGTTEALMKENHQMVVKASGNVGIGTTSPSAKLHTVGDDSNGTTLATSATNAKVRHENHSASSLSSFQGYTGNSWYTQIANNSGTTSYDLSLNPYGGNVGIGTTSPTEKLHIVGGDLGIGSTQYRENNVVSYASADYSIATSGAYNLTLKTNDTERMRIDSSGNVLVGKTSADNTTQGIRMLGSAGFASFVRDGAEPIVVNRLTNDGDLVEFRKDGTTVGSIGTDSSGITFASGGSTERMRIDSAGRVDITAANYAYNSTNYHIRMVEDDGSAYLSNIQGGLYLQAGGRYYGSSVYQLTDGATSMSAIVAEKSGQISFYNATGVTANGTVTPYRRMIIKDDGKVGIGTNNPDGLLHVSGGASGDVAVIVEADTDNNFGENDNPKVELRQDGGGVIGKFYMEGGAGVSAHSTIANATVLEAAATSGNNDLQFATGGTTGSTPTLGHVRATIRYDGKFGIGTAYPTHKLEVQEASPTNGVLASFVNSTNAGGTKAAIQFSNSDNTNCATIIGSNRVGANFGADFYVANSDSTDGTITERFRINENGVVNIPNLLQVNTINCRPDTTEFAGQQLVLNAGESSSYATGQEAEKIYLNAEGGVDITSSLDNWSSGWAGRKTTTILGDSATFGGTASFADTITAKNATFDNGNNTTITVKCNDSGNAVLNLMGDNQGTGVLYVGQSSTHGGGIEYNGDSTPVTSGGGSDEIVLYRRSSSVNEWTAKNTHSDNNWDFRGTITQNASDERLKENITSIENALEKVEQLRGVTFDWKDDVEEKGFIPYAKHETGVIAQDVQKVIPDAAVPAPFDENYLTVKHEKIIPLLIEAIKELKAEVESLKK